MHIIPQNPDYKFTSKAKAIPHNEGQRRMLDYVERLLAEEPGDWEELRLRFILEHGQFFIPPSTEGDEYKSFADNQLFVAKNPEHYYAEGYMSFGTDEATLEHGWAVRPDGSVVGTKAGTVYYGYLFPTENLLYALEFCENEDGSIVDGPLLDSLFFSED